MTKSLQKSCRGGVMIFVVLTLVGCTVGPDFMEPSVEMPDQWDAASTAAMTSTADLAQWWQRFDDPLLTRLVERTLEGNRNLQQAALRITIAREAVTVSTARLLPNVSGQAEFSRSRRASVANESLYRSVTTGGADVSWEIDLFGAIRRNRESTVAALESSEENFAAVRLELVAQLVTGYLQLRALQEQVRVVEDTVQARETRLNLAKTKLENGLTDGVDVVSAAADVESLQGRLRALEAQRDEVIYAIGVLVGERPEAFREELYEARDLLIGKSVETILLPAAAIARRPDVRRAAAELHAATAQVGVATAALYPQVSLSGSFGLQEVGASGWSDVGRTWVISPAVTVPIFNAGSLRANVRIKEAEQEIFLKNYEAVVLTALQEIETALVHYGKEQVRQRKLAAAVSENKLALEYTEGLYQRGLADYFRVLQAQFSLLSLQEQEIDARLKVGTYRVALMKALGGGW